jgi:hypothetical protein
MLTHSGVGYLSFCSIQESIIHGESTTEPLGVADIVDGQFEVQCTSSYLPQNGTSVRHASTKIVLHEDLNETKSEKEELVPSEEETDYTLMPEWRNQRRQLFIFSNSGKPVYSRYNAELIFRFIEFRLARVEKMVR